MDSGQGERLIKVLTQIKDRMPATTAPPAKSDLVPLVAPGGLAVWIEPFRQLTTWLPESMPGPAGEHWRRVYVKELGE